MRGNKFEKSHIHILVSETLSRESIVTEIAQEIVGSTTLIVRNRPIFTMCRHFYTLCGKERRSLGMISILA